MTNTPHRILAMLALALTLPLAGCTNKPGTSDIEGALESLYSCPILEVRDVKKINGEPGPQGTYSVAFSYTLGFKGGESGAVQLMTDWVALQKEALTATAAQWEIERTARTDPRIPAIQAYAEQADAALTTRIPCAGKEFRAVLMPLHTQADQAIAAGTPTVALPIGVQIVRTGVMGKSENGWYFRQLSLGFDSFEVLTSKPVAVKLPPSKVPGIAASAKAASPTEDERTLTGIIQVGMTDSCLAVDGNDDKCYGLPNEPAQAKRIFDVCKDGDQCTITGAIDANAEQITHVSKVEKASP